MKTKLFNALSLALIVAMLVTSLALADEVVPDGDIVTAGNQSSVNLGTVAPGATLTPQVSFTLVCSTRQHVDQGQTVNLSASAQTVPAGGSLSATNASISSVPAAWPDDLTGGGATNCGSPAPAPLNDNGNSTVTITAPTAGGSYTYVVRYSIGLSPAGNNDNQAIQGSSHIDVTYLLTVPSDATPPVITPSVSGTLGNNGWYTSDVTVSWTVTDPESSITSTSGCGPSTVNTDTAGTTFTCSATSAGGTNSASVTIKRDATAPTISGSASPGPNGAGWNNGDVTVSFSGTDGLSGIDSCSASVVLSSEGAGQSASGTCVDKAGNVSAPATATGINIDKTAPTFGSCPGGGPFLLGSGSQSVGPISVDAAISGLNAGTSTLSGSVDANSIGLKTVNFTAVDNADNSAGKSCSYSVIYNFSGFFQPVENPGPGPNYVFNRVKAGSAIPVKFSLSGDQGLGIMQMGYPKSENVSCTNSSSVDDLTETVTAGNSSLSYDPTIDQYNYVWKTDKAWAAKCRKLTVRLIDGTDHVAYFMFTK